MKEDGLIIRSMEKESMHIVAEINIVEIGLMGKEKDTEHYLQRMEIKL